MDRLQSTCAPVLNSGIGHCPKAPQKVPPFHLFLALLLLYEDITDEFRKMRENLLYGPMKLHLSRFRTWSVRVARISFLLRSFFFVCYPLHPFPPLLLSFLFFLLSVLCLFSLSFTSSNFHLSSANPCHFAFPHSSISSNDILPLVLILLFLQALLCLFRLQEI